MAQIAEHIDALASVYARSAYELAQQAGGEAKVAEIAEELEQVCELARADRRFREFLGSPIVDRKARSEALRRIFSDRVTDLTLRFLLVLNDKGRLGRLETINAAFDRLVQESYGRVEVNVYTPAPLGDEQLDTIRERIRSALGKEPVLHPYTEPAMIGGLKLRIGDQLIDGSVASRLRRLKNEIMTRGSSILRDRSDRIFRKAGEA
jgi:F-type H+-transporting ATPase subunit delta